MRKEFALTLAVFIFLLLSLAKAQNQPPVITIISPENTTYLTNTVDFNFTATDDRSTTFHVKAYRDGTLIYDNSSYANNTLVSIHLSNLADGSHYVNVWAKDTDGAENETAVYFTVKILAIPSIIQTIIDFLAPFYSIIFIIVFVLILLLVGGVIHLPSAGGAGKWIPVLIFAITIFVVPYILDKYLSAYVPSYAEVPENLKGPPLPSFASKVLVMLGLPEKWMQVPAIIYLFIIPFAGIYTIVWAFLQSLGMFDSRVNRILAILITFMTIPVGWFVRLTWLLFAGMGIWSVVVFAGMFILGIFFRGAGAVGKEYVALSKLVDTKKARLKDLEKELEALKDADLQTIQSTAPQLIQRFADVMNVSTQALLSSAIQAKKVEDARAAIDQAIKEVKKLS